MGCGAVDDEVACKVGHAGHEPAERSTAGRRFFVLVILVGDIGGGLNVSAQSTYSPTNDLRPNVS
jgi:hypothetical protein